MKFLKLTKLIPSIGLVLLVGCVHGAKDGGIRLSHDVDFRNVAEATSFRLQPADGAIRAEGGGGELLALVELRGDQFSVVDSRGRLVASVRFATDRPGDVHLLSPAGTLLLRLSTEPDGDLRVEDAEGAIVYKAKRRDYGFKVVDGDGRLESRIRLRKSKTSLRDASGTTYLTTRDFLPADAVAILSMESVRFEHAVGLSVALAHRHLDEAVARSE